MQSTKILQTNRQTGIELLKVIGIFLVVLSHTVQSLCEKQIDRPYQDYVIDLSHATTDIQYIMLSILRYSGAIGNAIFFVCTAWFLLDSHKFKVKKWFFMLVEVWVISVGIFAITYMGCRNYISGKIIIKCFMPTTFANNWYITCYLLFYPIHTILNSIISNMSQKQLLRSTSILVLLYMGFNFIKQDLFFCSSFIVWITIYFLVAYIKNYLSDMISDKSKNVMFLCLGITGHVGIILLTNLLGLRINFFSNRLLHWNQNGNPFIILSVIALFNLVRRVNFKSVIINYVSKLSMLVYIIHSNIVLRTYYKPYVMDCIFQHYGYSLVLLWVIVVTALTFIVSVIVSCLYDLMLRKYVRILSEIVHHVCSMVWGKIETFILTLH